MMGTRTNQLIESPQIGEGGIATGINHRPATNGDARIRHPEPMRSNRLTKPDSSRSAPHLRQTNRFHLKVSGPKRLALREPRQLSMDQRQG